MMKESVIMKIKLLKYILGAKDEDIVFLTNKLELLFNLSDKYSTNYKYKDYDGILKDIVNTTIMNLEKREIINIDNILYTLYKNIGDLIFDFVLNLDSWLEDNDIDYESAKNYLVQVCSDGINTVFDSPLEEIIISNIENKNYLQFYVDNIQNKLINANKNGEL